MEFGKGVIRFRWIIIILTLLAVVGAGRGMAKLTFGTDYRVFFSKENPQLTAFEALQDTYTKNDNVLFVVAPKDGNVFTPRTLSIIERLTEESWQVPFSSRVDSITNFQHTVAEGDDLMVADLVKEPASLSEADLEGIKGVALKEPLLARRLISEDGAVTAVLVTINYPGKSITEVPESVAFVREMASRFEREHPEIDMYLTGMSMMNNAFAEASMGDMGTLTPIMFGVIILVMWFLLRSITGTIATTLVIAFSTITAMGLAGWGGIVLSGPSVTAPTIILTLAVADSIHILVTFIYNMRHGMDKNDSIVEAIRINLHPIFLTSVTTAIGFLSMNFSDAPPFHDLGNIVAVGVMAAFVYSVLFLPALMSLLPIKVRRAKDGEVHFMDRFGNYVIARKRFFYWAGIIVIGTLSLGLTRIELDDRFVNYFDERYEFRTDTDFTTEHLTGIYLIEYSLGAGEPYGISEPEYMKNLDAFAEWYRAQDGVIHVATISDTMKRLNKSMHGDDESWYRLPDSREMGAQYLLLYEFSLPYGLDLNNQINVDKSETRFTVTLESISSNELILLEKRAQEWLKNNVPESMQTHGASPSIMFAHIGKRNIKSMLGGTAMALVLISCILIFALRSFKIGIISLVPNLAPAVMAFGLWGILYTYVGLALSVVTAMTLGIVVDDTVHFLSKYKRARHEHGMSPEDAVRYSFRTVGMALWVTSLILVAGFLVLTYSGFTLNSDMGLLTAIAIVLAIVADFFFLPTLLMKFDKGNIK